VGDDMVVMKLWMRSMRAGGQLRNENERGKQTAEKIYQQRQISVKKASFQSLIKNYKGGER
jgi:hypothetical protein